MLNTFSFDFENNDRYFRSNAFQPSQDRPWVDQMVKFSQTRHRYLECKRSDLLEALYRAVDARDLPCMADVESSMLYFCSLVANFNQVALTGECADEIFGGYPWFHKQECLNAQTFPWSMDLSARTALLSDATIAELRLKEYVQQAYQNTIEQTPRLLGESAQERRRREIAYLNLKWFMATLLDRMDRTSMHVGLEARVPFADHRIVEYVFNVPWEMKCRGGLVKGLLREAADGLLPDEILYRRKSPYPKTYDPDYENLLGKELLTQISDNNAPICAFIDKAKVARFLNSPTDYGKPFYGQLMAGPQMLAFMLQVNYWLKRYHVTIL